MQLTAQKRDLSIKSRIVRKNDRIPAVVYGRGKATEAITVDIKEFLKLFKEAGESTVISIAGLGTQKDALIHEVAFDALTGLPIHVDFYAIDKDKPVSVSVPLEFEGVSPAVKDKGAVLVKVMHELEIEALPKDLPPHIVIDISNLVNVNDQIIVSDISLPHGVTTLLNIEDIIVMAAPQEEEVTQDVRDISQIEVAERGKKEDSSSEESS